MFGADHIYRMDPRQMVEHHIESGAGVTVAGDPGADEQSATSSASSRPAPTGAILAFHEKPTDADGLPDAPDQVLRVDGQLRVRHRRR